MGGGVARSSTKIYVLIMFLIFPVLHMISEVWPIMVGYFRTYVLWEYGHIIVGDR